MFRFGPKCSLGVGVDVCVFNEKITPTSFMQARHSVMAEMEKRADSADISVLFFSLAVLIFWL